MIDLAGGPVPDLARRLLGHEIISSVDGLLVRLRITEVEAYGGADDLASHAARGPTRRNAVMFGPPGHLYVYRSYGVHWCANVVTGRSGDAQAVLLRGGEVLEGHRTAEARRGRVDHLADGPGKLAQALGITGDHDGHRLDDEPVRLVEGDGAGRRTIRTTARIGISRATEVPWRFVLDQEDDR